MTTRQSLTLLALVTLSVASSAASVLFVWRRCR